MRGMNMQGMMKQMQKLQKDMKKAQDELAEMTFTSESEGGIVQATFTGEKKLTDLQIKPEAIDPDDPDMLQDLLISAINDGLKKVDDATQQKLGKYTRGLPM